MVSGAGTSTRQSLRLTRSRRSRRPRRPARLAQVQRAERVDHDGQLVEVLGADRPLGRAGLRAVGEAGRVQRDRALLDAGAAAGLVVAAGVEQHLVGVDVVVVVRHRDRQRVVVDLARHERADHEVRPLERLVHRRRLVHPAGDRLEVVDRERPRVEAAVPADHVERVVGVDVPWSSRARCCTSTSTSSPSTSSGSAGPRRSRSQYGECSRNWPRTDR